MEFKADLHCHSTFSDGTTTPKELLVLAKEANLQGLSITDHDTTQAYDEALFAFAKEQNISLLVGVEISSSLQGENVHILAYGKGLFDPNFQNFLNEVLKKRKQRNQEILKKLKEKSMPIEEGELDAFAKEHKGCSKTTIGRPHIAQVMVEKGYVKDFSSAFQYYLKDGASCYVDGLKFTPLQVIEQVHQVKAKAVLAHPHFFKNSSLIKELLEQPFDGIEAWYGRLLAHEESFWVNEAKKRNKMITGGSDFHGEIKPFLHLGTSWVDKNTFEQLAQ